MNVDWYKKESEGRFNNSNYKIRQCTKDDFAQVEGADDKFYQLWEGYSLLCPDIPKGDGFKLQGSPASMISKNFQFSIKKCLNSQKCKNEYEIDNWIKDV